MIQLYATVATAWFHVSHAATDRRRDDRGVTTLEIVIIALGLLGLAVAAIAAITTATQSRINKIN